MMNNNTFSDDEYDKKFQMLNDFQIGYDVFMQNF